MPETISSTDDKRTVNNVMGHEYRVLTDAEKEQIKAIKDRGFEFVVCLDGVGSSHEISLAKIKIEEAVMWGIKHITA